MQNYACVLDRNQMRSYRPCLERNVMMKRDVAHLLIKNHYFPTVKGHIFNFPRQQPPQ